MLIRIFNVLSVFIVSNVHTNPQFGIMAVTIVGFFFLTSSDQIWMSSSDWGNKTSYKSV